ncbi:MAG: SRPBCC family protein [Salibacteraceae bacterium]
MKALKIIGGILGVIILAVVVMAFVMPTQVHVERSGTIDAPKDYVKDHISSFEMMNQWSPWTGKDPDMESSIEGEDGTVGAVYSWSGNDEVGQGTQTITAIEDDKVVTHMHFIAPMEGEADAPMSVSEEEGATKVTWAYDSDMPRPMNAMLAFMNMDDMLGPDFQTGIDNLKQMVEENKTSRMNFGGFEVQKTKLEDQTYVGLMDTVAMSDLSMFFEKSYAAVTKAIKKAGMEPIGMPAALYFDWNEETSTAVVMAGMPIESGGTVKGLQKYDVSGNSIMIDHYGAYEQIGNAHMALESCMNWHSMEMNGPAIEVYANDPTTVADASEINTKIYYPIQ